MLAIIKTNIRNFMQGIKNIIAWRKIIWNDRHWDFSFFLYILKHKLELMHRFYVDPDIKDKIVDDERHKTIEQAIKTVIDMIEWDEINFVSSHVEREAWRKLIDTFSDILKNNMLNWWD